MLINIITDVFYNESLKHLDIRGDVIQLFYIMKYLTLKSDLKFHVWQMGSDDTCFIYEGIYISIIKSINLNDYKIKLEKMSFHNAHYNNIDCFTKNIDSVSATIHTNVFLHKKSAMDYLVSIKNDLRKIVVVNKDYLNVYHYNNFLLIKNAIDLKIFLFKRKNEPDQKVKLFFPNLANESNKNLSFAVKVVELLNCKDSKYRYILYCCGDTKISKNIVSIGYVEHSKMAKWYHKCDFSLIPSISESCSLCFLESLSTGCYPLASDIIGLKEYSPNQNFLLKIEEPELWSEKIQMLVKNWDKYQKDVLTGNEWIKNNFSIETTATQYEKLWREIFYENFE